MHLRGHPSKNTAPHPPGPPSTGSSPLWIMERLTVTSAEVPQNPVFPCVLSAPHLLGQRLHGEYGSLALTASIKDIIAKTSGGLRIKFRLF